MSNSDKHPSGSRGPVPSYICLKKSTNRHGRPCFALSDGPQGDFEFTVILNTLKHKVHEVLDVLGASPEEKKATMGAIFPGEWQGRTWIPPSDSSDSNGVPPSDSSDSDGDLEVLANLLMGIRGAQTAGTAKKSPWESH